MPKHRELLVPSNILLFGEYAILEPGGLGISYAVAPYLRAWSEGSSELQCTGIMPSENIEYHAESTEQNITSTESTEQSSINMFQAVLQTMAGAGIKIEPHHLYVDSRPLFFSDTATAGRKRGFGSSAAGIVAVTAIMLEHAGHQALQELPLLSTLALQAHRLLQGSGSGYDVMSSIFGGSCLFIAGRRPYTYPISLPFQELSYLSGEHAVSSREAVRSYHHWKAEKPDQAKSFCKGSNQIVQRLIAAPDNGRMQDSFRHARRLSAELGRRLAVEAEERTDIASDTLWKFSGAGDELILFCNAGGLGNPLVIAQGAHWK